MAMLMLRASPASKRILYGHWEDESARSCSVPACRCYVKCSKGKVSERWCYNHRVRLASDGASASLLSTLIASKCWGCLGTWAQMHHLWTRSQFQCCCWRRPRMVRIIEKTLQASKLLRGAHGEEVASFVSRKPFSFRESSWEAQET